MYNSHKRSEEETSGRWRDNINNITKQIDVSFPLHGFLPKQLEVMKACDTHSAVLYSGAFRAGKTMLLVHVAIKTCLENPKCRGLIGAMTFSSLNNVVFRLFEDELAKYQDKINSAGINLQLAKRILHSQATMQVEFYNGSLLYFRACDEERKLAGYTLDFFGLDEPVDMDETIFNQLMGRISGTGNLKNRFGLLTTNPANQTHWIYKTFYESGDEGYKHVDTTTYDNILLPDYDKYIKRLEATWDEDWVRRYLNGTWGTFEGAIYKEFNPEMHVGDFKDIPTEYHIAGVDWGLRNPFAVIIAGVTNDKRIIVKEELYGNNLSTHELSKRLVELHKKYYFKKIYCDPTAADLILQGYNRGLPIGEKRNGVVYSYADNDVNSGIARLKSLFKNDIILMDSHCLNLKRELLAYRYDADKEKPIKKDDHCADAIRYLTSEFNPLEDEGIFEYVLHKIRKWS
jgi:PBSX family phage terminase large subunit